MQSLLAMLIVVVIVSSIALFTWRKQHQKMVEHFKTDDFLMKYDIEEHEKYKYLLIVDMYNKNLKRDPTLEELYTHFDELKQNQIKMSDVYDHIVSTPEYKQLQGVKLPKVDKISKQDIQDYDKVHAMVVELMPESPLFDKKSNRAYMNYLVSKFREFDRENGRMRQYIRSTPEYAEYEKSSKIIAQSRVQPTHTEELETNMTEDSLNDIKNILEKNKSKLLKSSNEKFPIDDDRLIDLYEQAGGRSKPFLKLVKVELGMEEETCEFYKKVQYLAGTQNRRNLDEQRYMCEMSELYENANIDAKGQMHLDPDQKWSVPQKKAPACHTSCNTISNTRSQSALIGTLLEDVEKESPIMPPFVYDEPAKDDA
jgi:hypothetical protein